MKPFEDFWVDVNNYKLETICKFHQFDDNYEHANGCGAVDGVKVPDTIYGADISPACIVHDIEWQLAECYPELKMANERFDNNLKTICDLHSANRFMKWLRRSRISKYVNAVELYGTMDYARKRGFLLTARDTRITDD